MINLSLLENLPSFGKSGLKKNSPKSYNPEDSIFNSILGKLSGSRNKGFTNYNLYADPGKEPATEKGMNCSVKGVNFSVRGKKHFAVNREKKNKTGETIIPASLSNQLILFLKEQGFTIKEINNVLSSSRNKEGQINLDSIFTKLTGNISSDKMVAGVYDTAEGINKNLKNQFISFLKENGYPGEKLASLFPQNSKSSADINSQSAKGEQKSDSSDCSTCIKTSEIPKVAELLYRLGMKTGDVKRVLEKASNSNGDLDTGILKSAVNELLNGTVSDSDLTGLFKSNGISVTARVIDRTGQDIDRSSVMSLLNSGKDLTEKTMEKITELLREKGIPEKEIKSFLSSQNTGLKITNQEGISDSGKTGSWNERILGILKNEKIVISEEHSEQLTANKKTNKSGFVKGIELTKEKTIHDQSTGIAGNNKQDKNETGNPFSRTYGSSDQAADTLLKSNAENGLKNTGLKSFVEKGLNDTGIKSSKENAAGDNIRNTGGNINRTKENFDPAGISLSSEKSIKQAADINTARSSQSLPQPLPRILDKMFLMIRMGEQRSRIQISPPELGKLDIDLTIKGGHLHANMSAESIVVKELIESNLNQLKQQLNNQGLTVDKFEVMVGLDNGDKKNDQAWAGLKDNNQKGRRSVPGATAKAGDKDDSIKPVTVQPGNNQIDVHV